MASSLPALVAETIQTAHIKRHPSPGHDLAPPTAADKKTPVRLEVATAAEAGLDGDQDDIPSYGIVKPRRRSAHLPPLPDLRFEQSYLHSIANANSWWAVTWVTARDQVLMPLVQGILYNLALCGWQYWNRSAQLGGNSVGSRIRRWWYGVNNWSLPGERSSSYRQMNGSARFRTS